MQLESTLGAGVLCHEMGHSLGLPDLYHYTADGMVPVGAWDIMAGSTDPPHHMSAYMNNQYGKWIGTLPTITASGAYSLNPLVSAAGNAYRIDSPNSASEYFVVEFRSRVGTFEASLPGDGMLVYRINPAVSGNDAGPPDEVYVFRPGGTLIVNGSLSRANFSSNAGRTAVNDTSDPPGFLSDGSLGGLDISSIGAVGSTMSFTVTIPPLNVTGLTVRPSSVLGGASATGTVLLSAVALSGGAVVSLSSGSSAAQVPASVTVPAGGRTATFSIATHVVASDTSVTVTAAYNGTTQGDLTVLANQHLTAAITSPGGQVSGTVTVTASATGDLGVAGLQFKLDGANLGPENTTAPYSVNWDTTTATNGSHSITAVARDAAGNVGTSPAVSVTVGNSTEFTFSSTANSSASATVSAGSSANYDLNVTPTTGFTGSVSLTCAGAVTGSTCSMAPASVTVTGRTATSTRVTVTTTARSQAAIVPLGGTFAGNASLAGTMGLLLPGVVFVARRRRYTGRALSATVALLALLATSCLSGCGGGNGGSTRPPAQTGTPAGTYAITVTGTAGTVSHTFTLTLTVN